MSGISYDFDDSVAQVIKIDNNADGNTYFGWSTPGASTAAPVWKIRRNSTSGTVQTFEWADGNVATDNIWDNRTSLTYL